MFSDIVLESFSYFIYGISLSQFNKLNWTGSICFTVVRTYGSQYLRNVHIDRAISFKL